MMKNLKYFLVAFLLIFTIQGNAQDRSLSFLSDLNEAKLKAVNEDKKLFIYIYADWCPVCKRMDKEVFSDPKVVNYISKRFIPVKLHGEKQGRHFAFRHKVFGFPSMLYFDPLDGGSEMHRVEGFIPTNRLISSAEVSFRNPKKQKEKFSKAYRKNKKNVDFLEEYYLFAEETEDWSLVNKIANQYAKNVRSIDSLRWMDFTMKNVYSENSKLFNLLDFNKEKFDQTYGEEVVGKVYLEIVVNSEMNKMNKPQTKKLIEKTTKRLKKYDVNISEEDLNLSIASRAFNSEIPFENDESRVNLAILMLSEYKSKIEEELIGSMLISIALDSDDQKALSIVDDELDILLNVQPTSSLHDLKSIVLYKLGAKEDSYKQVALAQKYATIEKIDYKSSLSFMKKAGLIK